MKQRIQDATVICEGTQQILKKMMPEGIPPLKLFKALANNERILDKLKNSNLLDHGVLSLKEREIIIDRTTAMAGAEYEWGVHIAFFAKKIDLTKPQIQSLAHGKSSDDCWTDNEKIIIEFCDELHHTSHISDPTYKKMNEFWNEEQIIEAVTITGYYRMISYLVNVIRPEHEEYAHSFNDYL